jgi:hypothetical protein
MRRLLLLFFVVLISCTKEECTDQPLLLSEVAYGTWERRAVLDPLSPAGFRGRIKVLLI